MERFLRASGECRNLRRLRVERVFNGTVQSTHQGLDFRVPSGTSVAAVNSGRVILAQPLFFEGNCVVIDHGQGLLTLYLHLSKFLVKEGDDVKKGQPIGLSGGTGRATGPHLHLAVRWQGVYLNPQTLLNWICRDELASSHSKPAKSDLILSSQEASSASSASHTPSRNVTLLPEMAGIRSPGTTIPTRFSGSAAAMTTRSRICVRRQLALGAQ